jgi:hypothetical protein
MPGRASTSTIDALPPSMRDDILDELLAGKSMTVIANRLGITRQAVAAYRTRTVLPAIAQAKLSLPSRPETTDNKALTEHKESLANLTKQFVNASPFRHRLEALWNRTDRAMDRSEKNDDLQLPALLNQAHKNLELLGRVTGELEPQTASVAIQIVIPTMTAPTMPEPETIDIALPPR